MKKVFYLTAAIFCAFVVTSCEKKADTDAPVKGLDGGVYTIGVEAPSFTSDIESGVSPRQIIGTYDGTGASKKYNFTWKAGDKLIITPYVGDEAQSTIEKVVSSDVDAEELSIDVELPEGTTHVKVLTGNTDEAPSDKQVFVQDHIANNAMSFESDKIAVEDGKKISVPLKSRWPIVVVAPTYNFSLNTSGYTGHYDNLSFNKIEVIQAFKGSSSYTYTYQGEGETAFSIDCGSANTYTVHFPIVVRPANGTNDSEKCKFTIKIYHKSLSGYATKDDESPSTHYSLTIGSGDPAGRTFQIATIENDYGFEYGTYAPWEQGVKTFENKAYLFSASIPAITWNVGSSAPER